MDLAEPVKGRAAVQALLEDKFPTGSKLIIERLSDGTASGGFTWHREAEGEEGSGLRGVTYVELNEAGKIVYVQEGAEPLFKLDKILEAVLEATNKAAKESPPEGGAEKPPPSYERANPTTASGIAKYLWEVACEDRAAFPPRLSDSLRFHSAPSRVQLQHYSRTQATQHSVHSQHRSCVHSQIPAGRPLPRHWNSLLMTSCTRTSTTTSRSKARPRDPLRD